MTEKAVRGFDEWDWHRSFEEGLAVKRGVSAAPLRRSWSTLPWLKSSVTVTYIERRDPGRQLSSAGRQRLVSLLSAYPHVKFRQVNSSIIETPSNRWC